MELNTLDYAIDTSSFANAPSSASLKAAGLSGYGMPLLSSVGAISSAAGSYYSAQSTISNLKFQQSMSAINARMLELQAQSILDSGNKAAGEVSLRAGKVKGSQRASQAARGIQAGVGNAAEEIATTDLMKETDMLTINANAVRQAMAVRMGAVNESNKGLMAGTMADSISPFSAAGTSLMESGTSVAKSWYKAINPQGYYESEYGWMKNLKKD